MSFAHCAHCGEAAAFRCAQCQLATYCGGACQTADWALCHGMEACLTLSVRYTESDAFADFEKYIMTKERFGDAVRMRGDALARLRRDRLVARIEDYVTLAAESTEDFVDKFFLKHRTARVTNADVIAATVRSMQRATAATISEAVKRELQRAAPASDTFAKFIWRSMPAGPRNVFVEYYNKTRESR